MVAAGEKGDWLHRSRLTVPNAQTGGKSEVYEARHCTCLYFVILRAG